MNLFKSSTEEKPAPVWFVAERPSHDSYARPTRESAFSLFSAWLESAAQHGEPFTPYERRRLVVTGPDRIVQPDDYTDPLVVGDAAVKAVLTPEEYRLIVQKPIASAFLES